MYSIYIATHLHDCATSNENINSTKTKTNNKANLQTIQMFKTLKNHSTLVWHATFLQFKLSRILLACTFAFLLWLSYLSFWIIIIFFFSKSTGIPVHFSRYMWSGVSFKWLEKKQYKRTQVDLLKKTKAEWNKGNLKGRKNNNFTTCLQLNSNVQAFRNNIVSHSQWLWMSVKDIVDNYYLYDICKFLV